MKYELFEQLRNEAEKQFLSQEEMESVKGGLDIDINLPNAVKCEKLNGYCPGNTCDPKNIGGGSNCNNTLTMCLLSL
ncbi:MAG: hypothetical protein HDR88_12760 [Bacteroides sp.]|nr:hypothetical protein [Bacteroides sp.]